MNVSAIESMESLAKQVLRMSEERRGEFFDALKEKGLSDSDVLTIKRCVGLFRLFSDPALYRAMRTALGEQLSQDFFV